MRVAIIYNHDITGVFSKFGIQNKERYSEKTVQKVATCLDKAGHNTKVIDGNMYVIERLQNFMPRTIDGEQVGMVFNMAYGIQGESRYTHLPSMLEMLGIPYIGSTPSGHTLALDKVMTKVIWQNKGLPTPGYWVFSSSEADLSPVTYPVIVKPKMESVSFGLKVVYDETTLRESIHFVVSEFQQQALVEQFIPGREFAVGLLGNSPVEAFPVMEFDLEGDPNAIQTSHDKRKKPRGKICPAQIPEELANRLIEYSKQAFRALELRDFARVDIRVDASDNIFLLEINSMASLGQTGSYVNAAKVAGYDYCSLVNRILDVATVRYFAGSMLAVLPEERTKKLSIGSRLRTFLRGRQQSNEKLLEKLVNINTHVRNIDGVNRCTELIGAHLEHLGLTAETVPQFEVGNLMYFTNCPDAEVDTLLLLTVDDSLKMAKHENFQGTEHRLYGTGIWENKGGVVACISALQALRFAKILRKIRVGVVVVTDSTISGTFSKGFIKQKAMQARRVFGLHGGNMEGSVITSRSGSALYTFHLKLVDSGYSENVAMASRIFLKKLSSMIDLGRNDTENVIAPHRINFESNIFKTSAFGTAKISVRFNTIADYERIDQHVRKLAALKRNYAKKIQVQLDGGVTRQPLLSNSQSEELFARLRKIARSLDIVVVAEHRWSSADICSVAGDMAKLDGLGPLGGFDKQKTEFILRQSMVDRAVLLALLLKD